MIWMLGRRAVLITLIAIGMLILWILYLFVLGPIFGYGELED